MAVHSLPGAPGSAQGLPGPPGPPGPQGPPGASAAVFEFNYAASTSAPPGATNINSNGPTPESSSIIWIDYRPVSVSGSYAPLFRTILPGDVLHIADKTNSAQYAEWTCSDLITDVPEQTYVQVPVSFVRATATAQTGQNVFLFLLRSAY